MIRGIAFWAILITVAAASSGAAALRFWNEDADEQASLELLSDCPTQFHGFKHAIVWQSGGKRLLIQADHACGDKLGHNYDLDKVTVSIVSGEKVISKLESASATLSLSQNKLVLGNATESLPSHCIGNPEVVAIDLASSEVRMPGRSFYLSNPDSLNCDAR
jgi:hypothetical protein